MLKSLVLALLAGGASTAPLTAGVVTYDSLQASLNGTPTTWTNVTGVTGVTASVDGWSISYDIETNLGGDFSFDSPLTVELTNFTATCGHRICGSATATVDFDFLLSSSVIPWISPITYGAAGNGAPIGLSFTLEGTNGRVTSWSQALSGPTYSFSNASYAYLGNRFTDPIVYALSGSLSVALPLANRTNGDLMTASLSNYDLAVGPRTPATTTPEAVSGLLMAVALAGTFGARWLRRREWR
jgi:hypothetical protein